MVLLWSGGCAKCERDPKLFVPGKVRAKFLMAVTPEESKQFLKAAGYTATTQGEDGWMVGIVEVPPGEECAEEKKLLKVTGVAEAAQLKVSQLRDAGVR